MSWFSIPHQRAHDLVLLSTVMKKTNRSELPTIPVKPQALPFAEVGLLGPGKIWHGLTAQSMSSGCICVWEIPGVSSSLMCAIKRTSTMLGTGMWLGQSEQHVSPRIPEPLLFSLFTLDALTLAAPAE